MSYNKTIFFPCAPKRFKVDFYGESPVSAAESLENNNSPGITGFETSSSTSYIHNHWHSGFGTADMFRTYSIMHGDLA